MPGRSNWGARLAAICVAVAACMAVQAQEPPARTIDEIEGHLASTRQIEAQKPSPQAIDVSADSGGAIFSPFTHVEKKREAAPRRTVEAQGESGKDSDSGATLMVVLACGAGLGILILAMRSRT
jgi:hypothetical protein